MSYPVRRAAYSSLSKIALASCIAIECCGTAVLTLSWNTAVAAATILFRLEFYFFGLFCLRFRVGTNDMMALADLPYQVVCVRLTPLERNRGLVGLMHTQVEHLITKNCWYFVLSSVSWGKCLFSGGLHSLGLNCSSKKCNKV